MTSSDSASLPDPELQRLETAKWRPSTLGTARAWLALFADDFVTIEYGADLNGGVERKLDGKSPMSAGSADALIAMLDQTQFNLSEWHSMNLGPDSVLLSYRVEAPALGWRAFATSLWQKRAAAWVTVFYQASRAK